MKKSVSYWTAKLNLIPHPEGGYYRETIRSEEVLPGNYTHSGIGGPRSLFTTIYFLLEEGQFSAFHKLQADEIWFFHAGGPLDVHIISREGLLKTFTLGMEPEEQQHFHLLVEQQQWFASTPKTNSGYALVSCVTAPGFDFADFELANRSALVEAYPQHEALIRAYTHSRG